MFELQIICATFNFVMWITPTEEIRQLTILLQYIFAENDRELWRDPNSEDPVWRA